jgi:hypothetical protein
MFELNLTNDRAKKLLEELEISCDVKEGSMLDVIKKRLKKSISSLSYIEVVLKDGTVLNCCIYEVGRNGEYPIISTEKIHSKFNTNNNNNNNDLISFQTKYINGKFHPSNVLKYEIK